MSTNEGEQSAIVKELRLLHICDTLEEAQAFAKDLGMTVKELIEDSRLTNQAHKEGLCPICFTKGKREPVLDFCHEWSGMQMITRCCERHYKRSRRLERNFDLLKKLATIQKERGE